MDKFEVSVVIPVYNAAPYVRQAVESALAQPQVREVLLVEDGSPDNALEVCRELAMEYPRVALLRHPNGENRGAGASRNLGMLAAGSAFLAFLDADDYYLPGRFTIDERIFAQDPRCEGVYHAVEMHVEDSQGINRWNDAGKSRERIQSMSAEIPPEALANALLRGGSGYFILDALTIRRSVVGKAGLMREDLSLHQDTEWILRTAMSARLLPGSLNEPVACWRVHGQNRISAPRSAKQKLDDHLRMLRCLYAWCRQNARQCQGSLMELMLGNALSSGRFARQEPAPARRKFMRARNLMGFLAQEPAILMDKHFWRALPGQLNLSPKGKNRR
ncbi:MAG TPA: glycosyltransferase family 2 protein [Anaerolineaceae bacterium]|nr:glycosyltransferase family 2 protein [Anaerolineaceae bacterium]